MIEKAWLSERNENSNLWFGGNVQFLNREFKKRKAE